MKKIFLLLSILCTALTLSAKPIDEKQARDIATNFFSQHMTRSAACNLKLEWAGSNIMGVSRAANTTDNPLLYIYNNESANGFVIVSGDTNTDLVIAYSLNNNFDADNMSEAAQALLDAWCRQIEDARNSGKHISSESYQLTRANDELLYDTALWSQSEPYNREAPKIAGKRSLTGCVATAMSIICYYHKWPNNGVGTTPAYTYVSIADNKTYSVEANPLGRPYEYSKMKKSYDSSSKDYTEEQAEAVAALMKDMGTAVEMNYHPEISGAKDKNVVSAFRNYFSYSKDVQLARSNSYNYEEWTALLRENLRNCGGPVYFSGVSYDGGGHAFVVDGYDADNHFHINYGWNGLDNGYYYLPASEYYKDQCTILNLKPDKDGTSVQQYYDHLSLVGGIDEKTGELIATGIFSDASSYSPGSYFGCAIGYIINDSVTTFNGYVALALCDKNGNIKELLSGGATSIEPGDGGGWDDYFVITETINEGDRLRVLYKGEYSSDWQWARKYLDEYTVDEVIVKASPEDIAKDLRIKYEKDSHRFTFSNKQAIKVDIYYHDTNKKYASVDLGFFDERYLEMTPGEAYRFEFSLGGEPYKLVIRP